MTPTAGKYSFETSAEELNGFTLTWWRKSKPGERRRICLAKLNRDEMQKMTDLFHLHIPKLCLTDSASSVQMVVPSDATAMLKELQGGPGRQEEILEGCCKLIQTRARMLSSWQQEQGGAGLAQFSAGDFQGLIGPRLC